VTPSALLRALTVVRALLMGCLAIIASAVFAQI